MTELRMLWALTGRLSPVSFTRAVPTGSEAVLTPAPPLAPGLLLSLSELLNVLLMLVDSGRFLSLNETVSVKRPDSKTKNTILVNH